MILISIKDNKLISGLQVIQVYIYIFKIKYISELIFKF